MRTRHPGDYSSTLNTHTRIIKPTVGHGLPGGQLPILGPCHYLSRQPMPGTTNRLDKVTVQEGSVKEGDNSAGLIGQTTAGPRILVRRAIQDR